MIDFSPIGTIHTPFKNLQGMPKQPTGAKGVSGTVELLPEYEEGLKDLEGFSHIILLYLFHFFPQGGSANAQKLGRLGAGVSACFQSAPYLRILAVASY